MTVLQVKKAKKAMLRARCHGELKNDVINVARLKQLDEADIVRIACSEFVQRFKHPENIFTGTNG